LVAHEIVDPIAAPPPTDEVESDETQVAG